MDEHDPVNHPAHAAEQPLPAGDPVHSPPHYTSGDIECIDAIEAAMTVEEFVGFLRGQMIKYVWRAGKKDNAVQDIEKALWYGNRLADVLYANEPGDGAFIDPATWLQTNDMVTRAQRAEAADVQGVLSPELINAAALAEYRDRAAVAAKEGRQVWPIGPMESSPASPEDVAPAAATLASAIDRDIAAMIAKRAELLKLSHLEDTDGNVVLMYSDHVNWDEAPEWANFLAYDSSYSPEDGVRAYWFEYRPEWRPGSTGYWRSAGQGGRIQYAAPYSGQGGDPRLFARATG